MNERDQIIYELHQYENVKDVLYLNIGDKISIDTAARSLQIEAILKDTTFYDNFAKRELNFRQLRFTDHVNGQNYQITVQKSLLSTEELKRGLGQVLLLITLGLIIALVLVSRMISKRVWHPFNHTLSLLKEFDISRPVKLFFHKTRIDEFEMLNEVLGEMIKKSQSDFKNLKEFGENTSHEIQTPLAIIKSKSELLLQNEGLDEDQVKKISAIYSATRRLSRLNQDLVLLAKINNNQFAEKQSINLKAFFDKKLNHFSEMIEFKKIRIEKNYKDNSVIEVNDTLAYVLVTNILNNAIRHNVAKGLIRVILNTDSFVVENTGKAPDEDPTQFFSRFKKSAGSEESSGIGLHLIKRICELYHLEITYVYDDELHKIKVNF